jgi:ankyrin repeat protein
VFREQDEAGQALYKKEDAQRPFVHPWRLPSLAAFLFQGLEKSYQRYKTWMTGPQLFAMFLLKSYGEVRKVDKSLQMEMLLAAAEKGHIPAQAVVSRVSQSYNIPHDVNKTFLYNGASYGSLLARRELEILDSALAFEALDKFRSSTGFNQFYSPLVATDEYSDDIKDAGDNTYIHFLSARGEFQKLRESLLANGTTLNINARNFRGETALYKACLTGCWETVRELCQHRADASISVLLNEVTCLHWLFNFPSTHVDQIATVLVNVGADLNALASPTPSIIDYHFPFSWPSGTPLHFATFASNPTAVTTLLKLGARAGLHNGRDPYLSDENVRQLHRHGTAEEGEFSEPDKPCLGLSSVDLATAMHDATVLECIRTHSAEDALFSPDEEGYTPFHRLSYLRVVRTYHGLRFWYPAFTGKSNDVKERLIKTIKVLQSMGGDINQLTNTPARPALRGVSGLSPLQIAVTKSDCEAVAALLECGADPNMVNRDGRSPLTLLAHVDDPCVTPNSLPNIVGLLLKYSPKVNHKSLDDVTPLGAAIASGSMPSVQALIDAGADPSSAESGVNIIAELMHQSSYQRRLQPPSVKSQAEAEAREQDIVRILKWLDLGSPKSLWVSKVDKDNGSLLHYASRAGLVDCVTVLINADLDINCIRKLHFVGAKPPSYSGTAGFMPAGTPLDIVERQHEDFISGKRDRMSQEGSSFYSERVCRCCVRLSSCSNAGARY